MTPAPTTPGATIKGMPLGPDKAAPLAAPLFEALLADQDAAQNKPANTPTIETKPVQRTSLPTDPDAPRTAKGASTPNAPLPRTSFRAVPPVERPATEPQPPKADAGSPSDKKPDPLPPRQPVPPMPTPMTKARTLDQTPVAKNEPKLPDATRPTLTEARTPAERPQRTEPTVERIDQTGPRPAANANEPLPQKAPVEALPTQPIPAATATRDPAPTPQAAPATAQRTAQPAQPNPRAGSTAQEPPSLPSILTPPAKGEARAPKAEPRTTSSAKENGPQLLPSRTADRAPAAANLLGQVAVVRQETHRPPVIQTITAPPPAAEPSAIPDAETTQTPPAKKPPFAAIAEQLRTALDAPRSDAEARANTPAQNAAFSQGAAKYGAPVRLVELSLQPAALGAVSVTLRLTGTGVRVTLSTTSRETAEILENDRDALASLIAGAGYAADEVRVTFNAART